MADFLVLCDESQPDLQRKIEELYPEDHYVVNERAWLVDAESTTDELADELGVREGETGRTLVIRAEAYSGWHKKSLWEWLESE